MYSCLTLKKSNCKNCYKCIRHCPVKSIRFSAGQAHIVSDECILCGHCFVVCPQNAKEIVNDVEKVRVMIQSGEPVYVSLAPSFIANYDGVGIKAMQKALLELGFAGVEETAIGATIVKTEYERILQNENPDILISSCCHSVNLLIQKYFPNLLPHLADVLSPMQAHAQDIKRRFPNAKVVFVGPCVAKKDEAERYEGYADAVLTFEELSEMLKAQKINLCTELDKTDESKARFFPTSGGVIKTMTKNENYVYLTIDGAENCISALNDIEKGNLSGCFVEMSMCTGSCIGGPVMEKYHRSPIRDYTTISKYAGSKDFNVEQTETNALRKYFVQIAKNNSIPSENEIQDILRKMGKTSKEQELNCGSCGYNTCREKAIAIYQGKADPSMCLPFLKDKAESFSDSIVKNSPNGLIVLNDQLEIQQINKSALKLVNVKSERDLLGQPIVRILDPKLYMQVLDTGKPVKNKRDFLAEYKKSIEQTIVYDNASRLLISIIRDITDEETEKVKKEVISKNTIEVADKVVEKQMRIVQEIASLLGETAAETKIALTKLKESIKDE
ncbi:MAG: 4Fe-4S binding protein [Clostridia bacterium]|nr:4Fe-4S binding protein [Clostridia bacterium]